MRTIRFVTLLLVLNLSYGLVPVLPAQEVPKVETPPDKPLPAEVSKDFELLSIRLREAKAAVDRLTELLVRPLEQELQGLSQEQCDTAKIPYAQCAVKKTRTGMAVGWLSPPTPAAPVQKAPPPLPPPAKKQ